jgi:GGDEF domain-containing protein
MSSENLKILEQVNKIEEILFSDGETAMSWLKELLDFFADNALYIAKNEGKNSYKRVMM